MRLEKVFCTTKARAVELPKSCKFTTLKLKTQADRTVGATVLVGISFAPFAV